MDSFELFGSYGHEAAPERAPKGEKPKNFAREKLLEIKKERERGRKAYLAMDRAWVDSILDCPEGPRLRALLAWAETLTLDQAAELVAVVAGEGWLLNASPDVRFVALRRLDLLIIQLRLKHKLAPIDDPIWFVGLPPDEVERLLKLNVDEYCLSAFQELKLLLNVR